MSTNKSCVLIAVIAFSIVVSLGSWSTGSQPRAVMPGVLQSQPNVPMQSDAQEKISGQLRESLDSMGRLPWYDAEEGQLEPVPVKPRLDDSSNRESRWVPKPKKSKANASNTKQTPKTNNNNRLPGFWSSLGTVFGDFSGVVGWILLGIIVALMVGLIAYTISKMEIVATSSNTVDAAEEREQEIAEQARLENLPVQMQKASGDFLAEADRLRSAGRLDEAIIYLFGHRLLQLDRAHAIRLTRGKTNRQYLNELRNRPDLRSIMEPTVRVFEQSYFGKYSVTAEQYDSIRNMQMPFESAIANQREAA